MGQTLKEVVTIANKLLIIVCLLVSILAVTFVAVNHHSSFAKNQAAVKKTSSADTPKKEQDGDIQKVGINAGKIAPDLTLTDLNGNVVNLSDFRGKKVLLNFWATWCEPCQEEIPQLVKFNKKANHDKVVILAVNMTMDEQGGAKTVRTFAEKYGMSFPVLLDQTSEAASAYGVVTIPTTYLISEKGTILTSHIGPISEKWISQQFN